MNDRNSLAASGLGPAFFNILATLPFQQHGPESRRFDLNNGPFMRDAAAVTLAFGEATKGADGRIQQIDLQVERTPYICRVRPVRFFAMGFAQHTWAYGYKLDVLEDDRASVKSHFRQTGHTAPAQDGSFRFERSEADFAISEQEGDGARLRYLYRQLAPHLPEAKTRLQLDW